MEKVCYFCALSCGDWAIKVIDWTHTCGLAGKSPPHIWCLTWLHASPKQISKSVCLATHFKDMTRRVIILPTAYSTYKQTNKHGNNNNKFVNNDKMTSSMSLSLPESGWAGGWRRGWPGEEDGAAAGPGQHGAERVHDPQPGIPRVPWPPWSPASGDSAVGGRSPQKPVCWWFGGGGHGRKPQTTSASPAQRTPHLREPWEEAGGAGEGTLQPGGQHRSLYSILVSRIPRSIVIYTFFKCFGVRFFPSSESRPLILRWSRHFVETKLATRC